MSFKTWPAPNPTFARGESVFLIPLRICLYSPVLSFISRLYWYVLARCLAQIYLFPQMRKNEKLSFGESLSCFAEFNSFSTVLARYCAVSVLSLQNRNQLFAIKRQLEASSEKAAEKSDSVFGRWLQKRSSRVYWRTRLQKESVWDTILGWEMSWKEIFSLLAGSANQRHSRCSSAVTNFIYD